MIIFVTLIILKSNQKYNYMNYTTFASMLKHYNKILKQFRNTNVSFMNLILFKSF